MAPGSDSSIRSVFHPTDMSARSHVAFNHALGIAIGNQSFFDILHVNPKKREGPDWSGFPQVRETLVRWGLLEKESPKEAVVDRLGIQVRKVGLHGGTPVAAITDFLEKELSDLIVLATEGRDGLPRWLNPSVSERLARRSKTTTLFVPSNSSGFVSADDGSVGLSHVLVPVDHKPNPQRAIDRVGVLLRSLGAGRALIETLFVGESSQMPAVAPPEGHDGEFAQGARQGSVADTIVGAVEESNADMIVMTTEGHNGFLDALRGSTTERVLRRAPCPLLAVPASRY